MTRPPLNYLRAFEAASRHLNFVAAAQELHLTPGAISHQIRQLEEAVGAPLFTRRAAGVALTPAGADYATHVRHALAIVEQATRQIADPRYTARVVVRCQFSFGANWLAPRLGLFRARFPEIDLVVRAEPYNVDPLVGGADIAVYYSRATDPWLACTALAPGHFLVVAPPALRDAWRNAPAPQMLQAPLLHLEAIKRGWTEPNWADWFQQVGIEAPAQLRGPVLSTVSTLVAACEAGAGLALVHSLLVEQALASGALAPVHELTLAAPHHYQLIVRNDVLRPEVETVRAWIMENTALG